ncbi:unnamed protein product, partial [Mesorhabditis spiculigera]
MPPKRKRPPPKPRPPPGGSQVADPGLEEEKEEEAPPPPPKKPAARQKKAPAKRRSGGKKRRDSSEDEVDADDYVDWAINFMEEDTVPPIDRYNLPGLLVDPRFDPSNAPGLFKIMEAAELTMEYYNEFGIGRPLLFTCPPSELGMTVPDKSLTVQMVADMVGRNRAIDIIRVKDQESEVWSLGKFADYYDLPEDEKDQVYNVLSLEFQLTPLYDLVKSPELVRQIDWTDKYWPDKLRGQSVSFDKKGLYRTHHSFPKIGYYCLMSPNKSYTDFHIDFGGTSVWYHVLKGEKIFFIVEPTEHNITLYEEYLKNQSQSGFFGEAVDKCVRVTVKEGNTLIIPAGWIHSVYTPANSLVFGGNFLHTMNASMQVRVILGESRVRLANRYRFPYIEEVFFYFMADLVEKATGRRYARPIRRPALNYDFTGKKWLEKKGHLIPIKEGNYPEVVISQDEDSQADDSSTVRRIAMHSDSSAAANNVLEESHFGMEEESPDDPDESPDPLVYYDPVDEAPVLEPSLPAIHQLPIDESSDGKIVFKDEFVRTITPKALSELTVLWEYMCNKGRVTVPLGVTRPASLLNCFGKVLEHRRDTCSTYVPQCQIPCNTSRLRSNARQARKRLAEKIESRRSSTASPVPSADYVLPDELRIPGPSTIIPGADGTTVIVPMKVDDDVKAEQEEEEEDNVKTPEDVPKFEEKVEEEPVATESVAPSTSFEENITVDTEQKKIKKEDTSEATPAPFAPLSPPIGRIPLLSKQRGSKDEKDSSKTSGSKDSKEAPKETKSPTVTSHPETSSGKAEDEERKKGWRKPPPRRQKEEPVEAVEETIKKEEVKDDTNKAKVHPGESDVDRRKRLFREEELKKMKKNRPSISFDDALRGTGGSSKSKTKPKKDDKPKFVDGMPVLASKELQEQRNEYNMFRPLDAITALGHTPLESAYRKSKSAKVPLIKPQLNQNKYLAHGKENRSGSRESTAWPGLAPLEITASSSQEPGTSSQSPISSTPRRLSVSSPAADPRTERRRSTGSQNSPLTRPMTPRSEEATPIGNDRRPSFMPPSRPLISPIDTPQAPKPERPAAVKNRKATNSQSIDNSVAQADERIAQMAAALVQLEAITREMAKFDEIDV